MNTDSQNSFLESALSGVNIFLTGKAGTGKSFIVKRAIESLKKIGKQVVALAPTGIAATNIEGQTIHSFFNVQPFGVVKFEDCRFLKSQKRDIIRKVDTFIIDEVSMLRPDLLDAINMTMQKNGCGSLSQKQVIFVGDLKQLPPVADDNTKSVLFEIYRSLQFDSARVYNKINPVVIELTDVLRQDNPEFIENLNIVREGGKSEYFRQFVGKGQKGVVLAPYNATVAKYNKIGLDDIKDTKSLTFNAVIEGDAKISDFNLEPILNVKHGAKIMYLVNSPNTPLCNGTLGTFIADRDGNYFIKVNGTEWPLEIKTFTKKEYIYNDEKDEIELKEIGSISQYPFKLAYAISIHKSQGLTFEECTIDLTLPCFQEGQLYVALSRVKTPEGLSIIY